MSASIIVSAFAPFSTLSVSLSTDASFGDVYDTLLDRYPSLPQDDAHGLVLTRLSGTIPHPSTRLSELLDGSSLLTLRLAPRILGGKGGFGSQLRAAGGRMSSQKTNNNDSCRDLSGRRLSTIKEAKQLAQFLEEEPSRQKAAKEASRAKLEALERRLGITAGSSTASGSGASGSMATEPVAGKKHRFDDTEYLEQSRELVDSVKSAVSAGLLKKKKKAKLSPPEPKNDPITTETVAPVLGTKTVAPDGDSGKVTESLVTSAAIAPAAAVAVASA